MSLVRAPVVNREQLQALRSLLKLDFTRCLRRVLTTGDVGVATRCTSILDLTDMMGQAEQPLIIVAALMQFHGTPTAMLPLDQGHFAFFSKLLTIPLNASDFPGLTDEQLEPVLAPIRACVTELTILFENAEHLDENVLKTKMKTPPPPSDMMN